MLKAELESHSEEEGGGGVRGKKIQERDRKQSYTGMQVEQMLRVYCSTSYTI